MLGPGRIKSDIGTSDKGTSGDRDSKGSLLGSYDNLIIITTLNIEPSAGIAPKL